MVPLYERPEDIPLLTQQFIKKYERILGKKISIVDERVMEALKHYQWPGNIRELQNVIERMMNFATNNQLSWELLPNDIIRHKKRPDPITHLESSQEREKRIIKRMLDLKFNKMQTKVLANNHTALRLYEKFGFTIEQKHPDKLERNSRLIDVYVMATYHDKWKHVKKNLKLTESSLELQ